MDIRLTKLPKKKQGEMKEEEREAQIINEIDCAGKIKSVYQKELELLKKRSTGKKGSERIAELESQINSIKKKSEEFEKQKKLVRKNIKLNEKILQSKQFIEGDDIIQIEVM